MSQHNGNRDTFHIVPEKGGGRLRACLACKLIKSENEWNDGCDNCQSSIEIYGGVDNWTTPSFTGMCALMDDKKSWVSKHQRIVGLVAGLYAIVVKGRLSADSNDHDDMDD